MPSIKKYFNVGYNPETGLIDPVSFLDEHSRGFHIALEGVHQDLVLLIEGPFKLPSVAVLTLAAYEVVVKHARIDGLYCPPPVLVDAATAAYLVDTIYGTLEIGTIIRFFDASKVG